MCTGAELIKYIREHQLEDFTVLFEGDSVFFSLQTPVHSHMHSLDLNTGEHSCVKRKN